MIWIKGTNLSLFIISYFFLISLTYVAHACLICLSFISCRISVCHWVDMAFIRRVRSQWASLPWLAPKATSLFPLQTPLSTQSGSISHSQVTGTSGFSPADTQSSVGTHSDMFLILCALCLSSCLRWGSKWGLQLPPRLCRHGRLLCPSEPHKRFVYWHMSIHNLE